MQTEQIIFIPRALNLIQSKTKAVVKSLIQATENNLKQNHIVAGYSYAQLATTFDANSSKIFSEKAFEIAKSLVSSPQNSKLIVDLGDFSNSFNNSLGWRCGGDDGEREKKKKIFFKKKRKKKKKKKKRNQQLI